MPPSSLLGMVVHRSQQGTDGRVRHLELDRAGSANAVDLDTLVELRAGLEDLGPTRVLVISGRGRHFCAGADLSGVEGDQFHHELGAMLRTLRDLPILTVCATHKATLGLGSQLAIACDLRTATDSTRFGVPAVKLGIMVDQFTTRRLQMAVGPSLTRGMLLAGLELSGSRAFELGIVHRLCDSAEALDWADELGALSPLSIAGHKRSLNALEDELALRPELADVFREVWASDDAQEGPLAFKEKRTPRFKGS